MSEELKIIQNEDGTFSEYDDTFDIAIHCQSEEEQNDVLAKLNAPQPCGDCISRQVVLEAIDAKAWEFCDYLIREGRNDEQKPVSHFADNLRECVGEDLPSVTPQPKMGKWLIKRAGDYNHAICSVCGDDSYLSPEWDALELYKYCPNCGAKMQEVEE